MYHKTYYCMQKYRWKDGSVHYYRKAYKKWVKYNSSVIKKRRSHIKNREPSVIFSKRFGYIELYNRKEQDYLKCPSGFSFTQGMGKLYKLWRGYIIATANENDIKRAIGFAKDIQKVQEDLGLPTTSFPHLGIYGDIFMLYEKVSRPAVNEDHSHLKEAQKIAEKKLEIVTLADEMNKIKKEVQEQKQEQKQPPVPLLLTLCVEQEIQVFTDDIPVELEPLKSKPIKFRQSKKRKIKHENRICIECGEKLELELNHECKQEKEKKELEIVTMTDDVPFQ